MKKVFVEEPGYSGSGNAAAALPLTLLIKLNNAMASSLANMQSYGTTLPYTRLGHHTGFYTLANPVLDKRLSIVPLYVCRAYTTWTGLTQDL